jgi:FkbM family methyltransferase
MQIADIGACDGISTVHYLRDMWPNATAVLFEALPPNIDDMERVLAHYKVRERCRIFECALAESVGYEQFYVSMGQAPKVKDWDTGNKSSSLLKPSGHLREHPWCTFRAMKVPTARYDSFSVAAEFVHIDVQGAELRVLAGMGDKLGLVRATWVEVATTELYDRQPLKADVVGYMVKHGFTVALDACGSKPSGDCLFVRK